MLDISAFLYFSDYIFYGLAFISAFSVVLTSVPLVREIATRSGHVDVPCDRKVHQVPVVRLGGLCIFVGTLSAAVFLWQLGGFDSLLPIDRREIFVMLLWGSGYFLLGFLDDLFTLSPRFRLICQFAIAALVWQ